MRAVTTFHVVDCNKALASQGLAWRIRLHDACGRQTLSLEPTNPDDAPTLSDGPDDAPRVPDGPGDAPTDPDASRDAARAATCAFFARDGISLEFASDGTTFWAADPH